jgi:hypothetical protein
MANRTDPAARSIHGTNPQNLIEKIVRGRIYASMYWKEHCFGLTGKFPFLRRFKSIEQLKPYFEALNSLL